MRKWLIGIITICKDTESKIIRNVNIINQTAYACIMSMGDDQDIDNNNDKNNSFLRDYIHYSQENSKDDWKCNGHYPRIIFVSTARIRLLYHISVVQKLKLKHKTITVVSPTKETYGQSRAM